MKITSPFILRLFLITLHIHKFATSSVFDTGAHTANLLVIQLMCPLGFRGLLLDFKRMNKMGS